MADLAIVGKTAIAAVMLGGGGWLALVNQGGTEPQTQNAALARNAPEPDEDTGTELDGMLIPVTGVRPGDLIHTFADARGDGRRHDAIDITAPVGTVVRAAADGIVEKRFLSRAGGNTVYLRSPSGRYQFYYAHLDRYAPNLAEGHVVTRGKAIGTVGHSGNADPAAPHLHFAILRIDPAAKWWQGGEAIDPYFLLR